MHHASAATGHGQNPDMPGAVWERIFIPEVRVCAGVVPGLREAA